MATQQIDLRSDTVTTPTEAMREAMASALVGDDGYGEDPTVNELEDLYAQLVGKEAAVFVPSGVMANQIAVRLLTNPGDVIAVGARQHVVLYEMGGAAKNSGVQFALLDDSDGVVDPAELVIALEGEAHHQPAIAAVFLENTHMPSGGRIWSPAQINAIVAIADGRPVHVDGARLFNAAIASGHSVRELVEPATTVMSCLSKGLSAPVGSLLAGPAALMEQARIERKRLGGAMRQAGILAAAGIVALETMIERLRDDHARAHSLAQAIAERWPDQAERVLSQPTNVVVFTHDDAEGFVSWLHQNNVQAGTIADGVVRFVTHRGIDDAAIEQCAALIKRAP